MMDRKELYDTVSSIEKKIHEAKEDLEQLINNNVVTDELDRILHESHDNLDSAWDSMAGICNRMDDKGFPEIK